MESYPHRVIEAKAWKSFLVWGQAKACADPLDVFRMEKSFWIPPLLPPYNSVGGGRRGGRGQCAVENHKQDRSCYPKEDSGLQYDHGSFWVRGDSCLQE